MAQIRIENVRKEFGAFTAVESSTFTVDDGDFFMLLGPSGCGKTTTLRMMAGLELPTSGKIYIDGEEVSQKPASQRDIAFVFQMFALYPHMNVRKNISYPLISQGISNKEVKLRVEEVAEILQIKELLNKPVSGLSGGDRQRVALGRAIVRRPKAFLMDEPLGALDAEFREHMSIELRSLHDRMGSTTIYVTHDQLEAMQMGDKIVVMNHGVVEQFGTPQDLYDWPATTFVASFLGSPPMNILELDGQAHISSKTLKMGDYGVEIPRLLEGHIGRLGVGVRPEHISISDDGALRGEILATEYLGSTQIVTVRTSFGIVKSRLQSQQIVTVGANVGLSFDPSKITVFNCESGLALCSELNEKVVKNG